MLENCLRESMERIKAILVELKIPFHFTGGIAVFYYGEPRFTQDLDLVIRPTFMSARRFRGSSIERRSASLAQV